jgi:transcriptional regulator with XRE-family HTH domain
MSMHSDISPYALVMEPKLTFGEWIEDQYLRAGFTQAEFADAINVAQSTVSGWVSGGKRPRRRAIPLIAKALNLAESEILNRAGYERRGPSWFEEIEDAEEHPTDLDDPLLDLWASYSGDLDPHDKAILTELLKSLAQKRRASEGGDRS